jgi:hypothetical protein
LSNSYPNALLKLFPFSGSSLCSWMYKKSTRCTAALVNQGGTAQEFSTTKQKILYTYCLIPSHW